MKTLKARIWKATPTCEFQKQYAQLVTGWVVTIDDNETPIGVYATEAEALDRVEQRVAERQARWEFQGIPGKVGKEIVIDCTAKAGPELYDYFEDDPDLAGEGWSPEVMAKLNSTKKEGK